MAIDKFDEKESLNVQVFKRGIKNIFLFLFLSKNSRTIKSFFI
jgi:hypothetical protein